MLCASKWGETYITWWHNHSEVPTFKRIRNLIANGPRCAWINKESIRKNILRDLETQSTFIIEDFLKIIDMIKVFDTVASAWDIVTPVTIRNSWKKLIPLPSSSMQINETFEEVTNNEFVQQFSARNITYTDDDI